MVSLNLPTNKRSSSSAVRILSIVPKGIKLDSILDKLIPDMKIGMTSGFDDYDSSGKKVRIFLDMVGCVGDTPAMNQVLDVYGHQANACCHLCRIHRKHLLNSKIDDITISNPRYMVSEVHGGKVYAMQSNDCHNQLAQCSNVEKFEERLGVHLRERDNHLYLQFRQAFKTLKNDVPKTFDNIPVVPSVLDPYRSLMIGPDHLIFGHTIDFINTALKLLPSGMYIDYYEIILNSSLSDARLQYQNNIINKKEKRLYSMKISEVFSILILSENALNQAIRIAESVEHWP